MSRLRPVGACLVVCLSVAIARCETTFPYVAYVAAPQSFARSGPGQQHYPTQQLSQGHAVEVYRHDSGGWCAVRPPEGSFCWIPAHEIHRLSPSSATVAVQTTIARVGSAVSPARSAVQVMLRRDEQVQILPAGANDDPRWLRIAPPAGEFRWIAASGLSRTPPVEGAPGVQLASGWMRTRSSSSVQTVANESGDTFAHLLQGAPVSAVPHPAIAPAPPSQAPASSDPNAVEVVAGSPAAVELARGDALDPPALLAGSMPLAAPSGPAPRTTTVPRIRFGDSPSVVGPGTERVQELQVRLSQIVIEPKEEWQFDQVQTEAAAMLESSDSVTEREHLRDLLDRIARFEHAKLGMLTATSSGNALAGSSHASDNFTGMTDKVRELAADDLRAADPFEGKPASADGPRYDAVGRLKPVVSHSEDAPSFALVNDQGAVVSFVTPAPDLNLRPYVGMRIGVNGSRGFMPEYRKAHVTAGRVTPIEDRIRR